MKMPISISYEEYKVKSDEFLVPNPNFEINLIGVDTGKIYKYGVITYIGKRISVKDIMEVLESSKIMINEQKYINILKEYLAQINALKIRNIIRITKRKLP